MTNPILAVPVGPLTALRAYLLDELAARNNPLPVGVFPPAGDRHQPSSGTTPQSYALPSRLGHSYRSPFTIDYLLRVRVFDDVSARCEKNCDLIYHLMMAAGHRKVTTPVGDVWISDTIHQLGPSDFDDPDVPLFGMQTAVFWTIGLKKA